MPSLHQWKAIEKANLMGAYAGNPDAVPLWDLSKRELLEIALRLGEMASDDYSVEGAVRRVKEEHQILKNQGLI